MSTLPAPPYTTGHGLLRAHKFPDLNTWLAGQLDQAVQASFGWDRPLLELAGVGYDFGADLLAWTTADDSDFAALVTAKFFARLAYECHGEDDHMSRDFSQQGMVFQSLSLRYLADAIEIPTAYPYALLTVIEMHSFLGIASIDTALGPLIPKVLDQCGLPQGFAAKPHQSLPVKFQSTAGLNTELVALAPHAFAPHNQKVHFLRPRWGGSLKRMYAYIDGDLCQGLTPDQRELLRVWAQTDHLDGFVPDDMYDDEYDDAVAELTAIVTQANGPSARAEALSMRASFTAGQNRTKEAAADFLAALQTKDPSYSFSDCTLCQLLLVWHPEKPELYEAAQGAFLAGNQHGAAILYLIYRFGLAGQAKDQDRADQMAWAGSNLFSYYNEWSTTANEVSVQHPTWAVALLEAGCAQNMPGCHQELANMYFVGLEIPTDLPRALAVAADGKEKGNIDAQAEWLYIQSDTAQTTAQARPHLDAWIDIIDQAEESHLERLLLQLDQWNYRPTDAARLSEQAYHTGRPWADAHHAFHLWFGIGTAKDREEAIELANNALEEDRQDRTAQRILRARRLPFLYWFTRPRKKNNRDYAKDERQNVPGVDVPY